MKKKILYFFPHNPFPPRTGAHRRCLEIFSGLRELGCEIHFASSSISSETQWNDSSVAALKAKHVKSVRIYEGSPDDKRFVKLLWSAYSLAKEGNSNNGIRDGQKTTSSVRELVQNINPEALCRKYSGFTSWCSGKRFEGFLKTADWKMARVLSEILSMRAESNAPLDSMIHTPPDFRRWFNQCLEEVRPDLMMMSYAHWDGLFDHKKFVSTMRVIDYLDLVSLNTAMQRALLQRLENSSDVSTIDEAVLKEDFFDKLNLTIDERELAIFDRYDQAIAINPKEAEQIRQKASHTKLSYLPVTLEPYPIENVYTGPALFPLGPNPFNLQGYLYFAHKVMPEIRKVIPEFSLDVTGSFYWNKLPAVVDGINLRGFVPDLADLYRTCRFVVCPVLGGTGQQIKIVEAMAHGVPVIATRFSAASSPIEHGNNGFVANDAKEFAEYVVILWNDRSLCERLGEAARETIASKFSRPRLLNELSNIVGPLH